LIDPGASPYCGKVESPTKERIMSWKKPRVTEVSLALEINSYACAEIG
jgi:coenzyme PQQ precursor peptide PqqA